MKHHKSSNQGWCNYCFCRIIATLYYNRFLPR
jgi:hypothetical protein